MLSRALSLATAMLVIVGFATDRVRAQNLEAGKSAAQIFSGNCTACHKGARGLLRTVPPGSLPGFLRQHYTTGPDMARMLSAYLISNGATDERYRAETPRRHPGDLKPESEPRQAGRQGRKPSREAERPDADMSAQDESRGRRSRHHGRHARPETENPEAARPASEEASKPATRKKLGKRGKQAPDEAPKAGAAGQPHDDAVEKPETAKSAPSSAEPAKGDTAGDASSKTETPKATTPDDQAADEKAGPEQAGKTNAVKPDASNPARTNSESGAAAETSKSEAGKSEAARPETAKPETAKSGTGESGTSSGPVEATSSGEPKTVPLRADPVPAVTPAPKVGEGNVKPPSEAATPTPAQSSAGSAAEPSPSTSADPAKPAASKELSPPAASSDAPPVSGGSSGPGSE
jgi:hypothetical protein